MFSLIYNIDYMVCQEKHKRHLREINRGNGNKMKKCTKKLQK